MRILLVDDHRLFREAIRLTLLTLPDIDIVAQVSNGNEVLQQVEQSHPDIVCMDINLPTLNGVDATRQLHANYPKIKIIALSSHIDPYLAARMINAGALGYVDKATAGNDLPAAIHSVCHNRIFLSPGLGIANDKELEQYLHNIRG